MCPQRRLCCPYQVSLIQIKWPVNKVPYTQKSQSFQRKSAKYRFQTSVARWYLYVGIYRPKMPIWVNFQGSCNEGCWYIFGPFDLSYVLRYMSWPFGISYGYLVHFFPFGFVVPRKLRQPCSKPL
jgi:hypothetical protein